MGARSLAAVSLLVLIAGCGAPAGRGWLAPKTIEDLPILAELSGRFGGPEVPAQVVARDQPTLVLLRLPRLDVDFSQQMVLFASLGRIGNDQTEVRIARVWREGSLIHAEVRTFWPTSLPARRRTSTPWHAVVVPRSDLNVKGFSPDAP